VGVQETLHMGNTSCDKDFQNKPIFTSQGGSLFEILKKLLIIFIAMCFDTKN
jgi:hypothetical protein